MSKGKQRFNDKQKLVNSNNQNSKQNKKQISSDSQKHYGKSDVTVKRYETKTHFGELLPLLFIIAILPLIVRIHEYDTSLSEFPWFSYSNLHVDVFLYYKQWIFITVSIFMVIMIAVKAYINKSILKFSPIFIPLAIYALLAFLSSLFSKYRIYSFTGVFEQFESVFVLLGYCIVVYYVYLFIQTENDVKFLVHALLIGAIILGLIGLSQFLGHDFYGTELGLRLITPRIYWNSLDSIKFRFDKNRVYLSLYNPNYVGVYVALVLPILLVLVIFNRSIKMLPIYLLAIIGLVISLIGSQSKAGIFAISVTLFITVIFFWRKIIKYFYLAIPFLLMCIATITLVNKKYDYYFTNQLKQITNIQKSQPALTDIKTLDDEVIITYKGNNLKIRFIVEVNTEMCLFDLSDDNNNLVSSQIEPSNGLVTIQDDRFPGFVLTPIIYDGMYGFAVTIDGHEWKFTNQTEDNTYYFINNKGKLDKIHTAPSALFSGYEKYASGRGYIWSRTIPLLANNIILGSGADTFVTEFPQQDYVNLYNYGFGDLLLTKPHNMYLQIGVQTGVISLLAFLVFYIMYFISSIRIYIKSRFEHYYAKVGLAIFMGTISYMIMGIANDSMITVAPIFWVLIGLGTAINHKVKDIAYSSK